LNIASWSVAIAPNRYQEIDWESLYKRLFLRAVALVGGADLVIDCGVSAEDLVNETLEEFFGSPDGLGWKARKGKIETFLGRVLYYKFIDHVRRDRKVAPQVDAADSGTSDAALEEKAQMDELQRMLIQQIKGRKDEHELEEFILAARMTTSEGKVNQQLADLLATDTDEVINRRKKLLRITGVREIHEQRRQGRKVGEGSR
jgi:DNA-directed RNA polymerase specialized sigma24 family protein